MGVLLAGTSRIALLHPQDGATDLSVQQGETLGQWHVKAVGSDAVTFALGDMAVTLSVFPVGTEQQ